MNRFTANVYIDGAGTASATYTKHDPVSGGHEMTLYGNGAGIEVELDFYGGETFRVETVGIEFDVHGGAEP